MTICYLHSLYRRLTGRGHQTNAQLILLICPMASLHGVRHSIIYSSAVQNRSHQITFLFSNLHEVGHAVDGLLLEDGLLQLPRVVLFVQADVTAHPPRPKFLEVGLGENGILRWKDLIDL